MDERDRSPDLVIQAIHERIAWITRMSARRVMTVSPPGLSSLASAAMKRSVPWIQSASGELPRLDGDQRGQELDQPVGGRVVEADGAADDRRGRAAAAVPQDLVALAEQLAREVEQSRCAGAGLAEQSVTRAVRHEREVAGP